MQQQSIQRKKSESNTYTSKTYNEMKEFEGNLYTGMRIGRSHKWYYNEGEWKEKKIRPDKWKKGERKDEYLMSYGQCSLR